MFNKKKLFSILIAMFMFSAFLMGGTKVRIGAIKGPTSMGMVHLFEKSKTDDSLDYDYKIVASPDAMMAEIGAGNLDIATVPANMASVIYNKTEGKYKIIDVNTLGMMYIASRSEEITNIKDLKGKTIYTFGKGAVPEYTLRTILENNEIDSFKDVTIEFKSQFEELVALLTKDKNAIVMIPQPFLTAAMAKNKDIKVNISINDAWDDMNLDSKLVQGTTIASNEFIKNNKDEVDKFLANHKESIEFINNSPEEGAKLVVAYDIIPNENIAKAAIPKCNMNYIDGGDMEVIVSGYLNTLFVQNPKSVGGKLPDKAFYYEK